MQNKRLSQTLVFIQFSTLGLILLIERSLPSTTALQIISLIGIALGIWAIYSMQIGNFRIVPDTKPNSVFKNIGPYQLIRHPMYLALIIFILPFVVSEPNAAKIILFGIFFINMLIKLNYEEQLLLKKFEEYTAYKKKTYRLIPFIY